MERANSHFIRVPRGTCVVALKFRQSVDELATTRQDIGQTLGPCIFPQRERVDAALSYTLLWYYCECWSSASSHLVLEISRHDGLMGGATSLKRSRRGRPKSKTKDVVKFGGGVGTKPWLRDDPECRKGEAVCQWRGKMTRCLISNTTHSVGATGQTSRTSTFKE